jgi:phage baseplate assembly protein W
MATDSHLLTDIRLILRHSELRPVYEVATERRRLPGKPSYFLDMGTVNGRENLAQAVLLRLLTPRGELAALGHPEYGSRLHELIGRENTATNRNLVKLFILESLKMEPRIARVTSITVEPAKGTRDRVNVLLQVQPVGTSETVTIGPFTLELQQ